MAVEDFPEELASLQQALTAPEPYFDAQAVADRLIWPTVDRLWVPGNKWRIEAKPGDKLEVPKSTVRRGVAVKAELSADCRLKDEDDCSGWEDELVHGVTIELQRELSEEMCDLLLTELRMRSPNVLEGVPRGDIVGRRVLSYFFDTEGVVGINETQLVRDQNGDQECYPHNMEQYDPTPTVGASVEVAEEGEEKYVTSDLALVPARIREHDLAEISLAINILTRSKRHEEIVADIMRRPIKPV